MIIGIRKFDVFCNKYGDYQVGKTIYEIGGKNKTRRQIKGLENALIVKDDVLIPTVGAIPLLYFGFLY